MRSPSCGWGCRRSSSARSAPAITAPRSGSRSPRCRAIARRSSPSCRRFRVDSMSEHPQLGWDPKKPPPSGDGTEPPKRKRYWWRFTLASVLIVSVSAAATATGILVYVDSVAEALSHNDVLGNKVDRYLSKVEGGEPQNILILGSDKRAGAEFEEDPGRSDTTILLRLDPDKDAIAVMSIPRALKVEIPGVGTEKFNAAYTYGGPKLTLQVVRSEEH